MNVLMIWGRVAVFSVAVFATLFLVIYIAYFVLHKTKLGPFGWLIVSMSAGFSFTFIWLSLRYMGIIPGEGGQIVGFIIYTGFAIVWFWQLVFLIKYLFLVEPHHEEVMEEHDPR